MEFETRNVTIEGPDLSGKTSLYNKMHQMSNFGWNIQDRSVLSMIVYARLYNRDVSKWRRKLWKELNDLNNRVVILMPSWDIIEHRYNVRGDEIQNLSSLKSLYDIFYEEVQKIKSLPTVIVPNPDMSLTDIANFCIDSLKKLESVSPMGLSDIILSHVENSKKKELSPLTFTICGGEDFLKMSSDIMKDLHEGAYYSRILKGVLDNIDLERRGDNEYRRVQDVTQTRRFIFTQSSCVSLIHTMFREGVLNVHVVCRSSDVRNTFAKDLEFLCYLSAKVHNHLWLGESVPIRINVTLNSAHVVD
jgi:hypothetical protein